MGKVQEKLATTMRYIPFLILSLFALSLPAMPAAAKDAPVVDTIWACAGYFEKKVDRAEASYGIRNYRERFLATKKGAVRRGVFVFPVAYRIMRDHLRSQTATRFGEESFTAYDAFDLRNDVAAAPDGATNAKNEPGLALQPGDQIAALPAGAGVSFDKTAAARMTTKPYNGVPSKKGWSQLHLMVLDGAPIVGFDSTLVVVWRYDSAEEWGTGESGSLFNFGLHRSGKTFVTSSEFGLMERLKKLYSTPFTVFPLSASGSLQKDANILGEVRAWLQKYKDDPEQDLQAKRPKGC